MSPDNKLLTATEVMERYHYTNRSSFWDFVHRQAVPFIRLNARKVLFDPAALAAWEAKRAVGGRR